MAIKGKKSKSKPKAPARAPRRDVVELPTPLLQRRFVQLIVVFALGLLVFWIGVWFTNGLRAEANKKKADKAAAVKTTQVAKQRLAVQSWKGTVDAAIGTVGTAPTTTGNPTVFADLSTVTASLATGTVPSGAADMLSKVRTNAKAFEKALNAVDIPGTIVTGKGFDVATSNSLIGSKAQMLTGLDLYDQSAALALQAAGATGAAQKALASEAARLQSSAAHVFNDGWRQLQEALGSVGIFPAPPSTVPGPAGGIGGLPGG